MLSCVSAVRSAARRVPAAAAAAAAPVAFPQTPATHVASPRNAGFPTGVLAAVAAFGIASGAAAHASAHSHDDEEANVPDIVAAPLDLSSVKPATEADVYGKPKVVFVLGGPGAGKGTQCSKIVEQYGFTHLSAGDLLRAERDRKGSQYGEMINNFIREGNIVPVEVTIALLGKAMEEDGNTKFLVDGFPRSYDNLQGWQRMQDPHTEVLFVLFYDTDEKVMEGRLLERAKTSGRTDDNLITIRKRFGVFKTQTMPVVEHYAHRGQVRIVDSSAPVEDVFAATQGVVEPIVTQEVAGLNNRLLLAVARGDAPVIARLSQGDAAETDAADAVRGAAVHVSAPVVTLHSADSATVAYNRKVVPPHAAAEDVTACSVGSEARTWARIGGKWVCTGVTRGDGLLGGVAANGVAWQQL